MDKDKINQLLRDIDASTAAIGAEVNRSPIPEVIVVPPGGDLQAALDLGGLNKLVDQGTYVDPEGYRFTVPNTVLCGAPGVTIQSDNWPALQFPMNTNLFNVTGLNLKTSRHEVVVAIGTDAADQDTIDEAPHIIWLENITIGNHRGKRGIEVNGSGIVLRSVFVYGLYDPEKQDSQGIWIGNAPGPVTIEDSHIEAASENIMVGGSIMKITGAVPSGIVIKNCALTKPINWRSNAAIPVKNLIELKNGWGVMIEKCKLWNCWGGTALGGAQAGEAFMFTPKSGGQVSVTVKDCDVRDVGSIVNITGVDNTGANITRTRVWFDGGEYRTDKAAFGGRGIFALLTGGPELFEVRNTLVVHTGAQFVYVGDTRPIDRMVIEHNDFNYGTYGLTIGGRHHGDNSLGIIRELTIRNNVIRGAAALFKTRYPDNTYV